MARHATWLMLSLAACGRLGFGASPADTKEADSHAPDTDVTDAGFFGQPRCPTNVFLCDDFEEAQVDMARWTPYVSNGSLVLDATRAARGTQALHLTGVGTQAVKLQLRHVGVLLPSPVYLRVFVYATQLSSTVEVWSWLFDSTNNGVQIDTSSLGYVQFDGWGVSGNVVASAMTLPLNRWGCFEWELMPGAMSMWIDDAPVSGLQDTAWVTPPSPDSIAVGLQYQASSGSSYELWLDELIVDSSPIGCTK